jgi:hypothetical protein
MFLQAIAMENDQNIPVALTDFLSGTNIKRRRLCVKANGSGKLYIDTQQPSFYSLPISKQVPIHSLLVEKPEQRGASS